MPERGKILFGQKQGVNSPFDDRIYELVWENSEYDAAEPGHARQTGQRTGLCPGDAMERRHPKWSWCSIISII